MSRSDHEAEHLVLLASSGGGHLRELSVLADRMTPVGWGRAWLVPETPSRVRPGDRVIPVNDIGPRDVRSTLRSLPAIRSALHELRPDAVVSTGAALAVPLMYLARWNGIEAHYVESATRTHEPSLSGRLVGLGSGAWCYGQWPQLSGEGMPWPCCGGVFDGFRPGLRRNRALRKVVVTLGTQRGYGFRRLVERLVELLPPESEVLWQTGATDTTGLPIQPRSHVPQLVLDTAIAQADLVVSHAGVGSAHAVLEAGRCPVLVPRERRYGEHVDDHQIQLASLVSEAGLAVVRRVEALDFDALQEAADRSTSMEPAGSLRLLGSLGAALAEAPHA